MSDCIPTDPQYTALDIYKKSNGRHSALWFIWAVHYHIVFSEAGQQKKSANWSSTNEAGKIYSTYLQARSCLHRKRDFDTIDLAVEWLRSGARKRTKTPDNFLSR
jgi:hypothetical protein